MDTGVFDEGRYFDVFAEYAKAAPDDMLIRVTVTTAGRRRRRSTCCRSCGFATPGPGAATARASDPTRSIARDGDRERRRARRRSGAVRCSTGRRPTPELLFTENETNAERLFGARRTRTPYVKDAFHDYVVDGDGTTR